MFSQKYMCYSKLELFLSGVSDIYYDIKESNLIYQINIQTSRIFKYME